MQRMLKKPSSYKRSVLIGTRKKKKNSEGSEEKSGTKLKKWAVNNRPTRVLNDRKYLRYSEEEMIFQVNNLRPLQFFSCFSSSFPV